MKRIIVIIIMSFLFVMVNAQNIAQGEVGTCVWYITNGGELVIAPTDSLGGDLPEDGWKPTGDFLDYITTAPWGEQRDSIYSAKIMTGVKAKSCSYMFCGLSKIKHIDLSNFNTENVTSMSSMFFGCPSLTSLDLGNFNTQKVTDMYAMFSGCSSLTSLDLSSFNTQNVKTMRTMFSGCSSLASLDLSSFNTQNVTDMGYMFSGCSSLTSLDLRSFNTQNVTNMSNMFTDCSSLACLDLGNFNTERVTDMSWMFHVCSSLTSLDLRKFNTQNVTDMSEMFYNCSSLTSVDLSSFNTQNVTSMSWMFLYCYSLKSLDLSNFNTQNVMYMSSMFKYCTSLTSLNLTNFNMEKVTSMSNMFENCTALTTIISKRETPSPLKAGTFDSLEKRDSCTLIVPSDTRSLYAARDGWNELGNIVSDAYGTPVLALTSEEPFYNSGAYTADVVTYTRNFSKQTQRQTSAGWETIVLPFDVQGIIMKNGQKVAPFGSALVNEGEALPFWLAEYKDGSYVNATSIKANVPYIINMPNGEDVNRQYRISGNVTFYARDVLVLPTNEYFMQKEDSTELIPTYCFIKPSKAIYAINDDVFSDGEDKFLPGSVFVTNTCLVRPFEAYFVARTPDAAARRYIPLFKENDETGIEQLESSALSGPTIYYNLSGQRSVVTQRGINIIRTAIGAKKVCIR